MYVCAKSLHTCLTLCNPMDCNPPGFSVHGILQARILEWVVMPSCRGSSRPRDRTHVFYMSCLGRWVLYDQHHRLYYVLSHVLLFCDPVNCSPPGSSVHGIFQARILKWIAYTYTYVYIYEHTHVYEAPGNGASAGKESACNVEDLGSIPELGRTLEEGKATHSTILAWRSPWTV